MAEQYIARFRTGTPEQRRAAIIKLGNGGDPRAISVLQQIAGAEPDPALQKLALQAMQHLQKLPNPGTGKASDVQTVPSPKPPVSRPVPVVAEPDIVDADVIEDRYEIEDPPLSPAASSALIVPDGTKNAVSVAESEPTSVVEPPRPKVVTEQQKELAKSKLDQVITYQIAGQYKEAVATLAEAASYDPGILNTTLGANLATTLTNMPRDQAIAEVLATSQTAKVKKGRNAPQIKIESGELLDTLLEAVILLIELLVVYGLSSYVKSISPSASRVISAPFSLKTGAADAISGGLPQFISTELSLLAVFVAGLMLGGSAGVLRFYRFLNRVYLFTFGALGVSFLLIAIADSQLATAGTATITATQAAILVIAVAITGISTFFSVFIQAYAVSRAHRFGYGKGCLSVIIGIVILVIFAVILGVSAFSSLALASGR